MLNEYKISVGNREGKNVLGIARGVISELMLKQ
jgi:hypothetical protein